MVELVVADGTPVGGLLVVNLDSCTVGSVSDSGGEGGHIGKAACCTGGVAMINTHTKKL